jgi:hypothetical protein
MTDGYILFKLYSLLTCTFNLNHFRTLHQDPEPDLNA